MTTGEQARPRGAADPSAVLRARDGDEWRLLAWCLRRRWALVLGAVAGGTVFQGASVAFPLFVQFAIDDGIHPGNMAATARWASVIVALALVLVAGLALMQTLITTVAVRTTNELRGALLDRALRLDRRSLAAFGRGDLVTRGTRDVDVVHAWLFGVASMITGCFGFGTILVLIAAQDALLAIVGLATVPVLIVLNIVLPKRFGAANARLSAAHGARADAVEELLAASAAVRGIGGEGPLLERHAARSATVAEETVATARIAASWAAGAPFVPGAATAVGLLVGGQAVIAGSLTIGGLVAFSSWMSMLGVWVGVLTSRFTQLGEAVTAGRRINEVLLSTPSVVSPERPERLPARAALRVDGVRVDDERGTVLGPVDLVAEPGELVAVTGPIGAGKSLLLRLISRWEDPDEGTVSYGGVDLRRAGLTEVRRRLVFVPQRPAMVSGTIAENLRIGRSGLTDAELRDACRVAAIDEHIAALPDGYDTPVGEQGSTLSGGQLQRLALARAVLHGADVLVLDDVTSAVDAGTERLLLDRLRAWSQVDGSARTVVFAGHRDAVVAAADRVVVLPGRGTGTAEFDRMPAGERVG
ncbi:multidrug ABC transporter ATP-binding protein [Amycolatopsis antarctica]|uniref:Multidrug ABC transporter ATP-binding protein n=1 Tax=Amycolatopsis antarctica TaxID=1854586 RepID=A0A263D2W7_9PSEU|nr:ABC transporter ATP-binding protein [Amycolatopsis antarctica]OZM71816.1 multidrug ABC transporter ATP-binding protein [Amycolatopsis antarctica]